MLENYMGLKFNKTNYIFEEPRLISATISPKNVKTIRFVIVPRPNLRSSETNMSTCKVKGSVEW